MGSDEPALAVSASNEQGGAGPIDALAVLASAAGLYAIPFAGGRPM